MKTPICDFVKGYAKSKKLRLHMPGHKGKKLLGAEALDITEIDGADVLYSATGIIKQSEEWASKLFGTAKTLYSTEGSSLAIRAMLYLAMLSQDNRQGRPIIVAARNAHKVFMTASALLDFDIAWIFPENNDNIVSCPISDEQLDKFLSEMAKKPIAVYITSPDYLGNQADIASLSAVCHKHGVLLLVDNAHGAYLRFLPENSHPIALGADICCDSAHKTLPVLTGGAYLHISKNAPKLFCDMAERAMSLFASTSPSYLILQSLDAANKYLCRNYEKKLSDFILKVDCLKKHLAENGYTLIGNEPLKITISAKPYGYRGDELAQILSEENIICEFCDADYLVLMLTPELTKKDLRRIEKSLTKIKPRAEITEKMPTLNVPKKKMSPREALFSKQVTHPLEDCCGKILASANVSCPPAIPIAVCGEVIDESVISVMKYYGIRECSVIAEEN